MDLGTKKKRKKRGRPFANKDLSEVLNAAAIVFSKKGFDGAQIKHIAQHANLSTSLLQYHIKTKEELWKLAVTRLGDELMQHLKEIESYFKDLEGIPLMKAYNRQFIYFSAKRPEFFKIAFHEISNESHRAEWMMDEILTPIHEQFGAQAGPNNQAIEETLGLSPAHVHSLVLGAANMFFALSFHYKRQYGLDTFDKEEIDKYVDFVNETIFARFKS